MCKKRTRHPHAETAEATRQTPFVFKRVKNYRRIMSVGLVNLVKFSRSYKYLEYEYFMSIIAAPPVKEKRKKTRFLEMGSFHRYVLDKPHTTDI